jgi:DNA-binding NarL/FixJ family response regulator
VTKCPECGAEAEVYSRITGYYRPVKNWNDGKAQEYKCRKLYDIDGSTTTTYTEDTCSCDDILSNREVEILRLIEKGLKSKEIASELFISINTVNRHRQNILKKLQASNSIEACRIAKSLKII